ncbi:MAG: hypothetical protein AB8C46_00750 [Burkholderiaceae bacterium]
MMPAPPPSADKLSALFPNAISGYSYGLFLRVFAGALVVLSVGFALLSYSQGVGVTSPAGALIGAVAIGMAASGWYIVMGKTTVDDKGIRQEWIMPKEYRWEEIFRARLISLPMNTRLMLNTGRPPFKTVHAGTPELKQAFREIAGMYTEAAEKAARKT